LRLSKNLLTRGKRSDVCVTPQGQERSARHKIWPCMRVDLLVLSETFSVSQYGEQLTPRTVLQDKIEFLLVLKTHLQLHQKRMTDLSKDLLLHHYLLLLILLKNMLLLQNLDRVQTVVHHVTGQHHLCVGTTADHRYGRELLHRHLLCLPCTHLIKLIIHLRTTLALPLRPSPKHTPPLCASSHFFSFNYPTSSSR
jgi:hypothetical protein